MNTPSPYSPEIPSAAATPDSELEGLRQQVDAAYEKIGIDESVFAAPPDDAVPVIEGHVIDEAKRQLVKKAEQAVLDALETMPQPDPDQFKDLLPG